MASLLLINQIESVQRAEYHPETVPKSPTYVPKQTNKKHISRAEGAEMRTSGAPGSEVAARLAPRVVMRPRLELAKP